MAESVGSRRLIALALGIEALKRADDIGEAVSMVHEAQAMSDDRWLDGVLHIIEANLIGYVDGVGSATAAAEAAVQDLEAVNDRWRTATALSILGTLRQMVGDYEAADRTHRQVLSIADDMGLDYDRFLALAQLANTALLRGDLAAAMGLAHEALAAARTLGGGARANALNTLGRVANATGRFADARSAHAEALRIYTGLDAYAGMAHSLDNLGLVASRSGDPDGGGRRHLQALEINAEKGDPLSVAFSLEGLALSLAMRDRGNDAARLLGAAHGQRAALGLPLPDGERRYVDMAAALARESADDFDVAFSEGETADWRRVLDQVR
jgi:tetratricopeptide (TPR) repeat protein